MNIAEQVFKRLSAIANNDQNVVIWYSKSGRQTRKFSKLYQDVDKLSGEFKARGARSVGILGPTCYSWLVIDLACLFSGIRSIAYPEMLAPLQLQELINAKPADLLMVHNSVSSLNENQSIEILRFNDDDLVVELDNNLISHIDKCLIQSEYTTIFSSGSTGLPKPIDIKFRQHTFIREYSDTVNKQFELFAGDKAPIWGLSMNKMIIFMPFSHFQQRQFAWASLMRKSDLLISTPQESLLRIVQEKPNIMISVPSVFEIMATIIEERINDLGLVRKFIFEKGTQWGLYAGKRGALIQRLYDIIILGKKVKAISGGRPTLFITGSAPISEKALRLLWSAGVCVYDIYSQSELGIISVNTSFDYRLGSVGKAFQDIKISEEGEIMVRYDARIHDQTLLSIDVDGYAHTGDMGRIEDGYLYHEGRRNSVIVLKTGKKIQPERIEKIICLTDAVVGAVVFIALDEVISAVIIVKDGANPNGIEISVQLSLKATAEFERPKRLIVLTKSECSMHKFWTTSGKIIRNNISEFGRKRFSQYK